MSRATPRRRVVGATLAALVAACAVAACGESERVSAPPAPPPSADRSTPEAEPRRRDREAESRDDDSGLLRTRGAPRVETVATGLEIPWDIAFLPDGRALVTERPGRLRLLDADGRLEPEPVAEIDVSAIGEGGLLGVAVDPRFRRNRFVYIYRSADDENQVLRYRLKGDRLTDEQKIAGGIEVGPIHDAGRLRFGPDGQLYLPTGDAGDESLAQDPGSLNGKVLRMEPAAFRGEGGRPEIFSLGHRNGQGLDWQPRSDRLFESEHGQIGNDEINVLREGRNYGWPDAEGRDQGGRFTAPVALYEEGINPSGVTFMRKGGSAWTGDLFVAALGGEQLRRLSLDGERVTDNEPLFEGRYGRLRMVTEGPNGALYLLTSNRDGRGSPTDEDDRILRVIPPED